MPSVDTRMLEHTASRRSVPSTAQQYQQQKPKHRFLFLLKQDNNKSGFYYFA